MIITATYQISFDGFALSGVKDPVQVRKYMRSAVKFARTALNQTSKSNQDGLSSERERGRVALSLGAYGATMKPSQEYSGAYDAEHSTQDQLFSWHAQRLNVFLNDGIIMVPSEVADEEEKQDREETWANVDLVAFETIPRVDEIHAARACVSALRNNETRDFWISCVFPGDENRLPDGSSVREVVQAMLGDRHNGSVLPTGIGINCTRVEKLESLVLEFEEAVAELVKKRVARQLSAKEWLSLLIYPDGTKGEVYNTTTKKWEKIDDGDKPTVSANSVTLVTCL